MAKLNLLTYYAAFHTQKFKYIRRSFSLLYKSKSRRKFKSRHRSTIAYNSVSIGFFIFGLVLVSNRELVINKIHEIFLSYPNTIGRNSFVEKLFLKILENLQEKYVPELFQTQPF